MKPPFSHIYGPAESDTKYSNTGATANLFKGSDTLISHHFFNSAGQPTFVQLDTSGNVVGSVSGKKVASSDQVKQADDGGFGSVPELLLSTVEASGVLTPSYLFWNATSFLCCSKLHAI